MYILDNFEIAGITRVVIHKKNSPIPVRVYNRLPNRNWKDDEHNISISDMHMASRIRRMIRKDKKFILLSGTEVLVPAYRLWLHNETVNIEKLYDGDFHLDG